MKNLKKATETTKKSTTAKIAAGKKAALAKRAGTVSAKGVSAKTNRSTIMATKKPTLKKTATPEPEAVTIDRKQLLALGAEFNTLVFEGSEVEYEEMGDEALEAQIRQDCTEIDPRDAFSDEAKAIIAELDIEIEWAAAPAKAEKPAGAKKAAPKKAAGEKVEKPVAAPKAKKETAPAKEKRAKADSGYTRSNALVDALEANPGDTREQIVAAADKLYVKNGGNTNPNVSNYMFGYVVPSLLILGIVKQEGKAFTWIGK